MVRTVLRLAREQVGQHGALAFVDDQRGHPTFTADLGPLVRRLALDRRSGVIHVTNQGAVSWYEFVQRGPRARPATTDVDGAADHDGRARPAAARRRARPTACSTTPCCRPPGIPLLRDFREPLAELVAALGA